MKKKRFLTCFSPIFYPKIDKIFFRFVLLYFVERFVYNIEKF